MDSFEEIQNLWLSEKADILPNSDQIKNLVSKYNSVKNRNIWFLLILLFLCFVTMVLVVIFYEDRKFTTIFGEILIFIALFVTIIFKLQKLRTVKDNELKNSQDFLKDLEFSTHQKSKFNPLQILALILFGIGYGFFIYETVKGNPQQMWLCYAAVIIYILLMYFVVKPIFEKKNKKQNLEFLSKIEKIKEDLC